MSAMIQQRRHVTAKVGAKRLGVCERTIRNYQAEARNWYEKRAAERRAEAFRLRHLGYSWAKVGEAMGCTAEAARGLSHRWAHRTADLPPQPSDNSFELFQEKSS